MINLGTRGGGELADWSWARGGDGNCTDNWGLLYKDNTRHVGQPSPIQLLFSNAFLLMCQIGARSEDGLILA